MPRNSPSLVGKSPYYPQDFQPEALEPRQLLAGMPADLPGAVTRLDTGTFFRINFGNGFFAVFNSTGEDFFDPFPSPVVPPGNLFPIPSLNAAGLAAGPKATIVTPDTGDLVAPGEQVSFNASATSANGQPVPSANYVWRVSLIDGERSRQLIEPILGVSFGSFLLPSLGQISNDSFVRITVTVSDTSGISASDSIDLIPTEFGNEPGINPPRAVINFISPPEAFRNGDAIRFGGFGFDPDEGVLPIQNLTWRAALHRDGRRQALIDPIVGVSQGAFTVPGNLPPLDGNDFIRVTLTATDSTGRRDRTSIDLFSATPIDEGGDNTVNDPEAQIIFPLDGDRVVPGQQVRFFGQGIDRQDGTLPNRAFTWRAALHDDGATRSIIDPIRRTRNGSFVVPENLGDVGENAFIRLSLTVRDSGGNTDRQTVDLRLDSTGAGGNVGTAPEPRILLPGDSTTYVAGDTINFSGTASDAEDGVLVAPRFEWRFALHQGDRSRQLLRPVLNTRAGSFTVPRNLPSNASQFIRISLTVTDSDGRTTRVTRDIRPRTSTLRVGSNFPNADLSVRVGGKTRAFPVELDGVVGTRVAVSAPRFQTVDGTRYEFVRWSDDGARTHRVRLTPGGPNLTAIYRIASVNT